MGCYVILSLLTRGNKIKRSTKVTVALSYDGNTRKVVKFEANSILCDDISKNISFSCSDTSYVIFKTTHKERSTSSNKLLKTVLKKETQKENRKCYRIIAKVYWTFSNSDENNFIKRSSKELCSSFVHLRREEEKQFVSVANCEVYILIVTRIIYE